MSKSIKMMVGAVLLAASFVTYALNSVCIINNASRDVKVDINGREHMYPKNKGDQNSCFKIYFDSDSIFKFFLYGNTEYNFVTEEKFHNPAVGGATWISSVQTYARCSGDVCFNFYPPDSGSVSRVIINDRIVKSTAPKK